MAKQNTNSKKGFTIIEVVLVLAIAGLIFLMVFIAWPALQRSQKDTQRRDDYAMLSTAISNYITNNNGKLSNILSNANEKELLPENYINETGEDPDGHRYDLKAIKCSSGSAATDGTCGIAKPGETGPTNGGNEVYVVIGADCSKSNDNGSAPTPNNSSRAFAIYGYLQGGNGTFCSASQ